MDLKIRYYNGMMSIYCEEFFPCSQAKLKKLLKIIKMADDPQQRIEELKDFLLRSIEDKKVNKALEAAAYVNSKQLKADLTQQVSSGKYPNGVPIRADELKEMKKHIKTLQAEERDTLKEAKQCQKDMERLMKNLEVLNS